MVCSSKIRKNYPSRELAEDILRAKVEIILKFGTQPKCKSSKPHLESKGQGFSGFLGNPPILNAQLGS